MSPYRYKKSADMSLTNISLRVIQTCASQWLSESEVVFRTSASVGSWQLKVEGESWKLKGSVSDEYGWEFKSSQFFVKFIRCHYLFNFFSLSVCCNVKMLFFKQIWFTFVFDFRPTLFNGLFLQSGATETRFLRNCIFPIKW